MDRRRLLSMLSCGLAVVSACVAPAFLFASPAGAAPHYVSSDFDGDGVRDLAIGAPGHDRVQVRYTRDPHVAWLHANATSLNVPMDFGSALAVGDFNGDGYSDLAVGAPNFRPHQDTSGGGVVESEGAVFEFRGSSTGLHARLLRGLHGPYNGGDPFNLGQALAAADVNNDGYADLATTLLGVDTGNIQVFRGSATGLTRIGEQDLNDYEATSLAFGDVNGDHHPDLVAGSTVDLTNPVDSNFGDVKVFLRSHTSRTLRATPQTIRGQQVGVHQGLGSDVAAGDINSDGYGDVVVGAALDSDSTGRRTGSIVVLTGSAAGLLAARHQRFTETRVYGTTHNYDLFGNAVAIGKVTSDGYADVLVGAPQVPVGGHAQAGAIYLLRGSSAGLTLSHHQRFTQSTAGVPGLAGTNAHFGASLFATQLVGTANSDLAIGAPGASFGAAGGGLVVRLRGASSGLTTTSAIIIGDAAAHDHLGTAIR